jgi:hypothetical protein
MNSQTRFLSVSDTEAAASSHSNRGRHRGGQIKFFTHRAYIHVASFIGSSGNRVDESNGKCGLKPHGYWVFEVS